MRISELLSNYVNRDSDEHKRAVGRYWATDIGPIMKGYLTPENFFERKPIDLMGCRMVLTGICFEDMLKKMFETLRVDCESQIKKEIKIDDEITLVVKTDFVFKDFVIETKFPFSMIRENTIPDRYVSQLECEYRSLYKRVYLGVFSVPFDLKLIEYIPSQRRWNTILRVLKDFHQKLKQLQKNG